MAFHEQWMDASKRRRIGEALALVPPEPGVLVEVGAWEGRSTIYIAQALPGDVLHVIDHWQGDLTDPTSIVNAPAAERDVYADFMENVTEAGVADRLVIHRADWRSVFADWSQPIRFIFIDGEHTYREVADNILVVLPLLVNNAVVCGDDYTHGPVRKAVTDTLGPVHTLPGKGAMIWRWQHQPWRID